MVEQRGETRVTARVRGMMSPGRDLPVRILIHEDADPEDVRRLFAKALRALDVAGFDYLRAATEADVLARAGIGHRVATNERACFKPSS